MDTHMTHLELEPSAGRSARLPDEPDLTASAAESTQDPPTDAAPDDDHSSPPRTRKRRRRLLSGVALGALIVASAGVFLLSPFNTVIPVPPAVFVLADQARHAVKDTVEQIRSHATELGSTPNHATVSETKRSAAAPAEPVVAPAASLAATQLPPRPASVTASRYEPQPREQSLDEVLALGAGKGGVTSEPQEKPHTPAPSSPAASKPPVAIPAPSAVRDQPADIQEPGAGVVSAPSGLKPVPPDITTSVTQAALAQPSAATSKPEAAPAQSLPVEPPTRPQTLAASVGVREPSAAAVSLAAPDANGGKPDAPASRPAVLVLSVPAGHQEQAEVLQYVTGLVSEIARLRTENETLRKDVGRRMAEQDSRMADLNRRVSVAETRAAIRTVAEAGKSEDLPNPESPRPLQVAAATNPIAPPAAAASLPKPASRLRYRVQAASPGLALLAEVGRGGGDGAQLQVAVGDQIPGYGIVKSVSQRGPNWVVQTEHGAID